MWIGMDNSSKFDFNNWRHQIAHGVSDINALMALMPQDDSISPWLDRNFTTSQLPFSVTPYIVPFLLR
jgi:L-lysine 2,3-aminomutase